MGCLQDDVRKGVLIVLFERRRGFFAALRCPLNASYCLQQIAMDEQFRVITFANPSWAEVGETGSSSLKERLCCECDETSNILFLATCV